MTTWYLNSREQKWQVRGQGFDSPREGEEKN